MSEESPNPSWGRIFEIFHDALERAPGERAAWISAECRGDRALESEVLSLLAAHDGEAGVLDEPKRLDPILLLDEDRAVGDLVGPYRIVRRLGEGGMGVVFAAEQEEPIRRTVALKLVKLGMDTREVLARFATERQTLALMEHPNIATVHDAGATPSGRPYFVMELVDGAPITRYADERRLTTRERLEMFVPVCRAVQHAHQKGIIHRDLKPSNVLVVERDGRPVPRSSTSASRRRRPARARARR
jgi:serine/threonine protein kinase